MAFAELLGDRAILVTGSLCAQPSDRWMDRSEVRPLQYIDRSGIASFEWADRIGELGFGSCAWDTGSRRFYFSTGPDLHVIDLDRGDRRVIEVSGLKDVHEILWHDGLLQVANTGHDEVVAIDAASGEVRDRFPLRSGSSNGLGEVKDRHHLNQVFVGVDGEYWGLVHHVEGRQVVRVIATKALKTQGDGGVVRLGDGRRVPLRLTAPHSVTIVGDHAWIFDSGRRRLLEFDEEWAPVATVETMGWGRGAALDADRKVIFGGISPLRRRYLEAAGLKEDPAAFVEAYDLRARSPMGAVRVAEVEQINNVYLVDRELLDALRDVR